MGYNEHALWIQAENIKIIYMLYCVSTSALNFQDLLYSFNIMYMVNYVASTLKLINWMPCIFAITGFTNIQRGLKHISLFPCVILFQIYLILYLAHAHTSVYTKYYSILVVTWVKKLGGKIEIQNRKIQWYIIEIRPLGMLRVA